MSLMVIERSSNIVVGWNSNNEKAFNQAIKRGVARADMVFVVDDPDIRAYRTAQHFVGKYMWLPQYLFEKGKGKDVIDLSVSRLNIWQQIMASRVVDNPGKYPISLSVIFSQQLANEINLVSAFYDNPEQAALAPVTLKTYGEALQWGNDSVARNRYKQILLAVHKTLGVYVVGPSELIARHSGFTIKRIFVRELRK